MAKIKLFIIDENAGVRRALAARLGSSSRLVITGTAGSLNEGLRRAAESLADVLLIDAKTIRPPEAAGKLRVTWERAISQQPQIIVLTAYADEGERTAARQAGAGRYLLKDIDSQALIREIEAIDSVARRA